MRQSWPHTQDCRLFANGLRWRVRVACSVTGRIVPNCNAAWLITSRIFRGASAAELPIEGPTHFQFTVNLKTAKTLGLTIPPAILARADEVIE